jgi:hypothetical protein
LVGRLVGVHAQDDDLQPRLALHRPRRHLDPVQARHRDVEDRDVRFQGFAQSEALRAVAGLADDLYLPLQLEERFPQRSRSRNRSAKSCLLALKIMVAGQGFEPSTFGL